MDLDEVSESGCVGEDVHVEGFGCWGIGWSFADKIDPSVAVEEEGGGQDKVQRSEVEPKKNAMDDEHDRLVS